MYDTLLTPFEGVHTVHADMQQVFALEQSHFFRTQRIGACVYAIDGGNQVIYDFVSCALHIIRVACVRYYQGQFTQTCATYLVYMQPHGYDVYTDKHEFVQTCACSSIDEVRVYLEQKHAQQLSVESHSILLFDGTPLCMRDTCLSVGISKQCSLLTDKNIALSLVADKLIEGQGYVRVGQDNGFVIVMARLHPKAKQVFRVDIPVVADSMSVLGQVASMCNDMSFVGYPYPLIKADMLARVSNDEVQFMQHHIMFFMQKYPLFARMHAYHHVHGVLDAMRF
ncbi:MAG: DNA double-strand break repair nuclease NurA [Candidatus Woesearchaeota archaeon]